jgi:hypothetical protein
MRQRRQFFGARGSSAQGTSWARRTRRPDLDGPDDPDGAAAATRPEVPVQDGGLPGAAVTVAVIGCRDGILDLATYLPDDWRISWVDDATGVGDAGRWPDVIVLTCASAADVRALCGRCGDVPVLSTVTSGASANDVIESLRAGADACIRSEGAIVLSAHIRACHRRRHPMPVILPASTGRLSALSGTGAVA